MLQQVVHLITQVLYIFNTNKLWQKIWETFEKFKDVIKPDRIVFVE